RAPPDHPLAGAPLQDILPKKQTAGIFSAPAPPLLDRTLGQGNIAKNLHVHGSIFEPLELVVERSEISQQRLLSDELAVGSDACKVIGVDLAELSDVAGHHCISHRLRDLLYGVDIAGICGLGLRGNDCHQAYQHDHHCCSVPHVGSSIWKCALEKRAFEKMRRSASQYSLEEECCP